MSQIPRIAQSVISIILKALDLGISDENAGIEVGSVIGIGQRSVHCLTKQVR